MPQYDASFVGLTILDVSGFPVRSIPDGGDVEFIEEIRLNPAGTAAGALMNAAKLGLNCCTVACVGNDEKGDFIIDYYRRLGPGKIDVDMVQRTTKPTSSTILPIRPNGDRPALHVRGASDRLFISEQDFAKICDCRFLHHGGTGLLEDMDKSSQSVKLLSYAKSAGRTTSLDLIAPNADTLDLLKPMLPYVDFFMPSIQEALFISKLSSKEEAAKFFIDLGAGACIFKCGERGSFIKEASGDEFTIPAFKVPVKDTTGCGDAYCGGFLAGLSRGMNIREACRLGTATSALVATGLGSDAGVIDIESTLKFMNETEVIA